MDTQEAFQQFMQNPVQNIINAGVSIPEGMTNGNDILNYLLANKVITQEQCNQAVMKSRTIEPLLAAMFRK